MKRAITRFRSLADRHGNGTVALANMGSRGVRMVFVAGDGTWGDVVVPNAAAADLVCAEGGWTISGWDAATTQRITPSAPTAAGWPAPGAEPPCVDLPHVLPPRPESAQLHQGVDVVDRQVAVDHRRHSTGPGPPRHRCWT